MRLVSRLIAPFAAAPILAAFALAACALDWDVRPDPGSAPDVATPDTSTDAADGAEADGASDAPGDDGAACAALLGDVNAARVAARACQLGQTGQCTSTVKDECDCNVVVRLAVDSKTDAFVAAVAAYRAACAASCAACPQEKPPASWACLQSGSVVECFP